MAGLLGPSCSKLGQDQRSVPDIQVYDQDVSSTPEPDYENEPWTNYRLPDTLIPEYYDLKLFPDFYDNRTKFSGNVSVTVYNNDTKPARFVLIHIKRLDVTRTSLTSHDEGKQIEIAQNFSYPDNEYWVVEPRVAIAGQTRIVLGLSFEGSLVEGLTGLYRSSYIDGQTGRTRYLVSSKFQPTDARKAFPCFDEPGFKSEFKVTLIHRPEYHALSNMPILVSQPIDLDLQETQFYTTPLMVTYLACFVISDFTFQERTTRKGIPFRVYAPPDRLNQSDYALDIGVKVLDDFTDYFDVEYPLPKLDMIAIPDFDSGAMEHWGLITYRETNMLYDPEGASVGNLQRVGTVVAHELAHMWFGNLVTMEWWDDLWLNEGFASFMEYKGVERVHPDWHITDQFLSMDVQPVMVTDAKTSSHPIVVPVAHPDEITEVFDSISYSKGASVIRMLEMFMEPDYFKQGIRKYIKKYELGNTWTYDLWQSLGEFAGSEMPGVAEVMDTWTRQMGYPIITVTFNGSSATLHQDRFLLNPTSNKTQPPSPYDYLWKIPITFISSDGRTNLRQHEINWLTTKKGVIEGLGSFSWRDSWVKFNVNQTGFYRVNYPDNVWESFGEHLQKSHEMFSPADRSNLLDDIFSFARAQIRSYGTALKLASYLDNESHVVPWKSFFRAVKYLSNMLSQSRHYGLWQSYIQGLVGPALERIGYENDGEHMDRMLRGDLVNLACRHEHIGCLGNISSLFNQWLRGEYLPADIRANVYRYGMRQAVGSEAWHVTWSRYKTAVVPQERRRLLSALTDTRSLSLLTRLLELCRDENEVRSQDFFTVIAYIGINDVGNSLAWDWLRSNWSYLVNRFGTNHRNLGRIVPSVVNRYNTEFKLKQVKQFYLDSERVGAGQRGSQRAIENIENNIAWMRVNEEGIATWLRQNAQHG